MDASLTLRRQYQLYMLEPVVPGVSEVIHIRGGLGGVLGLMSRGLV